MTDSEFIKARLLQIECEMNSMVAENKQREMQGYAMAYGKDAFDSLFNQIQHLIENK
jgi:hypothetical protein